MPMYYDFRPFFGWDSYGSPLDERHRAELLVHVLYAIYLFGFFGLVWFFSAYFARVMAELARASGGDDCE
jgi:hypothetical protein